jgi:hypothetical protein
VIIRVFRGSSSFIQRAPYIDATRALHRINPRITAVKINRLKWKTGLPVRSSYLAGGDQFMLWTIFVVLLILWLLGFSLHVAGGLIHLLLVIALIVLIVNLVSGGRTVA